MNLGVIAPAGAENEITNGLKRKPALRETSKREEGARENECFPTEMYQWTHPFAIRGPGILTKKALPSPFGWIIQHCSSCARKACRRRIIFIMIEITLSCRGCNNLLRRWFCEFRPCCTHSLTHLGVMLYFYEWDSAGPHSTLCFILCLLCARNHTRPWTQRNRV